MEKLRTIKDLKITVSDRLPIIDDEVVNVNKQSVNYGLIFIVRTPWIDSINWKVVVEK